MTMIASSVESSIETSSGRHGKVTNEQAVIQLTIFDTVVTIILFASASGVSEHPAMYGRGKNDHIDWFMQMKYLPGRCMEASVAL